jgi:nardilysin
MAPNMNNQEPSPTNNSNDVILGPDLNSTKSQLDKKQYRHITLPNGLKCVLICDTVAMRQRKLEGCYDSEDEDDASTSHDESMEDRNDDDDDDSQVSNADKSESNGLRKAATALSVNVGSYHDPPYLQGLSHFLEHMLFLGTESFPGDNEYDAFLAKMGGDNNAFTDMEYTCYHYCIPQDGSDGSKNVWKALEMFSSFFVCPLLGGEQAERELNAVESEFELNKSEDENRLSQVMSYTCGMDGEASIMGRVYSTRSDSDNSNNDRPFHPFAKFAWGNEQSLKTEPEANGVDVMKELRDYYHTHYYAKNMRLVVMAGYELDEIQSRVVQYFSKVPSNPRLPSPTYDKDSERGCITNLHPYRLPFHSTSLNKIYRIVPVKDRHTLTITWQIPSMCPHWQTKPADYIAHLLGHEASGSVLSSLKLCGWAMGCSAGTGDDGESDASTHALFMFQVSLSKKGMGCWEEVVRVGMCLWLIIPGHHSLAI